MRGAGAAVPRHARGGETVAEVGPEDERLLDQAARLFEEAGVHLLERRARGIDPVGPLRALRTDMPRDRAALHRRLLAIFARYGDRHSRWVPPPAWSERFAFLPFVAGSCTEDGETSLLVTGSACGPLRTGDRLIAWNGMPIAAMLEEHGAWQLGANAEARRAKAVQTLTVRPLALLPPPDEAGVELVFEREGARLAAGIEWRLADGATLAGALGEAARADDRFEPGAAGLTSRRFETPAGPASWIRIHSLRVPPDTLVPALGALLARQPSLGTVIDLRGCEEGFVQTGEAMLRLFCDGPIDPLRFEMRATRWMGALVRSQPALVMWEAPVEAALAEGRRYCEALPLNPADGAGTGAAAYRGRLIVLVDALTYSTAEMFAAGVQDHGIGTVLGVAPRTGGGGGAAWSQGLIHRLSGDDFFAPSAAAGSLRMAVMRCRRTGANAGRLIEGEGVVPDRLHLPTRRDLLGADADLVERVGQMLAGAA